MRKLFKAAAVLAATHRAAGLQNSADSPAGLSFSASQEKISQPFDAARRLDSTTTPTFFKALGGLGDERCNSFDITSNGYALTGLVNSYGYGGGFNNLLVTALDASGNPRWSKALFANYRNHFYGLSTLADNGSIFVTGQSYINNDGHIITAKLSEEDGSFDWVRTWGDNGANLRGRNIQMLSDGTLVVTASHGSASGRSYVITIDGSTGDLQWIKSFDNTDLFWSEETSDGGIAVTGETTLATDEEDITVTKLKRNGELDWHTTFGWSEILHGSYTGKGRSICESIRGNLYLTGRMYANHEEPGNIRSGNSVPIIKLTKSGDLSWVKSLILEGSNYNRAIVIRSTQDKQNLIIAGYYESQGNKGFVAKLDRSANVIWAKGFGVYGHGGYVEDVREGPDGSITAVGFTDNGGYGQGADEIIILKLDQNGQLSNCTNDIWDISTTVSDDLSYYFSVEPTTLNLANATLEEQYLSYIWESPSSPIEEAAELVCGVTPIPTSSSTPSFTSSSTSTSTSTSLSSSTSTAIPTSLSGSTSTATTTPRLRSSSSSSSVLNYPSTTATAMTASTSELVLTSTSNLALSSSSLDTTTSKSTTPPPVSTLNPASTSPLSTSSPIFTSTTTTVLSTSMFSSETSSSLTSTSSSSENNLDESATAISGEGISTTNLAIIVSVAGIVVVGLLTALIVILNKKNQSSKNENNLTPSAGSIFAASADHSSAANPQSSVEMIELGGADKEEKLDDIDQGQGEGKANIETESSDPSPWQGH